MNRIDQSTGRTKNILLYTVVPAWSKRSLLTYARVPQELARFYFENVTNQKTEATHDDNVIFIMMHIKPESFLKY
jgi:hypothetical protein